MNVTITITLDQDALDAIAYDRDVAEVTEEDVINWIEGTVEATVEGLLGEIEEGE